ncbi:MAG: sulfate/thiosulfate transport system substrate-binding protein [Solirubrobacteraceae bacterium]|jgi:sulfate transport system substrate-binding protein|nr:sulfate/thiosulfate transport system substrate-binding protein [Solirubrobacteraceae bacterium]
MRRFLILPLLALVFAVALTGCGGSSGSGSGKKVTLAAYSTPKEAYAKLITAFNATPAGTLVSFSQSFGASGEQSRAVDAGLPADVVAFSLEPDVTRLVKSGLVSPTWNAGTDKGNVTDSVVVLAVRKGNPKHIRTFDDLIKPGVKVVTPNPITSGGARWNVMAAYGAARREGKSDAQAIEFLKALFKNVVVQDKSARESLQTFSSGKGDVLVAYENEAITAQKKGIPLDYVIPDKTILIENPVAVTKRGESSAAAKAFVAFLHTAPAQKIFAAKGYRPVLASEQDPKKFPKPPGLFTIAELGGWKTVSKKFFDPSSGVVAGIERSLGVSTASG